MLHREEALQHEDDELHRSVIVVEHQDFVIGGFLVRGRVRVATPVSMSPTRRRLGVVTHRPTHTHSLPKIWQAANA
jgi:hypothetical protein